MTHIMLDVQTLGLKPGCVVLSVAMVRFSDMTSMSITLERDAQVQAGLIENTETLAWWNRQSAAAIDAAFASPHTPHAALVYIGKWLRWAADSEFIIWCHGAGFDAPILETLYERFGLPCPWSFRQVRDTRTLYDLAGVDLTTFAFGERHVALNDALTQTRAAVRALQVLQPRYVDSQRDA
jgi:hypothetical protein